MLKERKGSNSTADAPHDLAGLTLKGAIDDVVGKIPDRDSSPLHDGCSSKTNGESPVVTAMRPYLVLRYIGEANPGVLRNANWLGTRITNDLETVNQRSRGA